MIIDVIFGALIAIFITLAAKLILLRSVGQRIYGSDAYFYILLADIIREQKHRLPRKSRLLFGGSEWQIPCLQSWICSFVSRDRLERYQALVPVGSKCLLTLVIALSSGFTVAAVHAGYGGPAAFIGGIIYGLSPINRNANHANPMDFTFSPRSFSAFLTCLGVALSLWAAESHSWSMLLIAAAVVGMSLMSSLFSAQVAAFTLGAGLAIGGHFWGLLVIPLSIVLATLFSRGYYAYVLYRHVEFSWYYCSDMARVHLRGVQSSLFGLNFFRVFYYIITFQRHKLLSLVRDDVILRGLFFYPLHLVTAGLCLYWPDAWVGNSWAWTLAAFWLAALLCFALTSLPWFKFLGEADRYLEYAGVLPATVLPVWAAVAMDGPARYTLCAVLLGVMGLHWIISELFPAPRQEIAPQRDELWAWLRANCTPENNRVVCVPISDSYEAIYRTGLPFLSHPQFDHRNKHLLTEYPVPNLDPAFLKEQGVTHLILRCDFVGAQGAEHLIQGRTPVFSNPVFQVFHLDL